MDELLKQQCTFSPEGVFEVSLSNRNLSHLPAYIEQIPHLVVLDLHNNVLSDFALSDAFNQLKFLDLSFNRIRVLSLTALPRLEILRLQGNHIDSFETLRVGLATLSGLTDLSLKLPNGDAANPVCYLEDYARQVALLLPTLLSLDGSRPANHFAATDARIRALYAAVAVLRDRARSQTAAVVSQTSTEDADYSPDESSRLHAGMDVLSQDMAVFMLSLAT